ncbi:MAG: hypothetical protein MUO73_07680, partial [Thermoplasmata archaeon]|nr:hypothetical protein [Thermoplasmata archaeon]
MGNKIAWLVVISLVCSPVVSVGAFASAAEKQAAPDTTPFNQQQNTPVIVNGDPSITIVSPAAGYLYLFKLQPIKMPFASMFGLGYAVVVGRSINLDTEYNDIHHVKFVAKRMLTGWETVRWDYRTMDGLGTDFGLTSGLYTITVVAYNETDYELSQDSIKVLYMKIGREDFGVWVNTKYNDGETIS